MRACNVPQAGFPATGRAGSRFAIQVHTKETDMTNRLAQDASGALRDAVLAEMDADPAVHEWEIGVAAEDGVITLTGVVATPGLTAAAERAAKRVDGVKSIANDIQVRSRDERTDTDIAREVTHRLRNNLAVPLTVQAVVRGGHVTLDGTVAWPHQRAAAETAVKYLRGVTGVTNSIRLQEL
jgi:osmotically-inducible protein OsmY